MSNLQQANSANLLIDGIIFTWHYNGKYANRLVGDISAEKMVYQQAPAVNHPAWVLSHLSAYHGPLLEMLEGKDAKYPMEHKFGKKSTPISDISVYPSKQEILDLFNDGHEKIETALRQADDSILQRAMPMENMADRFPTVGSCLGYLFIYHESLHLGQLSAWRRVQGLGAV